MARRETAELALAWIIVFLGLVFVTYKGLEWLYE